MQDFSRLNYDSADEFDLKGSYALAKYVMHKPIDDLTVNNLRATLHANAKGSEVSAVAGSVSVLGGIALSAMSIATAGWTLATLLPVAGVAASVYLAGSALNAVSRYNAESNLLAQSGMPGHLEHLQDLLDQGVDPRVIAHDVQILLIHALSQNQRIELKSLAYSDRDILSTGEYSDECGAEHADDEEPVEKPSPTKPVAQSHSVSPSIQNQQNPRQPSKEGIDPLLDRSTVLRLFSEGIFTPRVVTGESQVGKTSFVNEFAIEAKKQGMKVWLLNLGYSDESPLLAIADRTCLAGWKFASKATPADRKLKIKQAIELLNDFVLESETLLVIDELSTLYLNEALDDVRTALQSAIDQYSIDGRKFRSGIVAIATPLPANKDRDKVKLTGLEAIPFVNKGATGMIGFSSGGTTPLQEEGLESSRRRFIQMPNGGMVCVDRTSVSRPVILSNVFDPLAVATTETTLETYAVGLGVSKVEVEPAVTKAQAPSRSHINVSQGTNRGNW